MAKPPPPRRRVRLPSTSPRASDEGLIDGRFVVLELIDQGGQAQIFRGRDEKTGAAVAIKVLLESFAKQPEFHERLAREAQALAQLRSPGLIRTFGFYWTHDQRPCVVMELLCGRSLGAHLDALESQRRRLSVPAVVACMGPVAHALSVAHAAGIIHRDLKPDNIFVLEGEQVDVPTKLLDFGFAKFLNHSALTAEGSIAGSPRYIAPEAWRGERELTPSFDVYSFGAVVFRCLAGAPPYPETSLARLLTLVTTASIPSIHAVRPDLPPTMDDWMNRSLAKYPSERFGSVQQQFHELERIVLHEGARRSAAEK